MISNEKQARRAINDSIDLVLNGEARNMCRRFKAEDYSLYKELMAVMQDVDNEGRSE